MAAASEPLRTRRVPCPIAVYAGNFPDQPTVFAYLADAIPALRLDEVEVICRVDPRRRLQHAFLAAEAEAVEDALGTADTCVLIFPEASDAPLPDRTTRLHRLGVFRGHRHRPETS